MVNREGELKRNRTEYQISLLADGPDFEKVDFRNVESDAHETVPEGVILPAEAVNWISKIDAKSVRRPHQFDKYTLEITGGLDNTHLQSDENWFEGSEEISVSIFSPDGAVDRTQTFDSISGVFPPVIRFLNDWAPLEDVRSASFLASPKHFELVTRYASSLGASENVSFEMGKNSPSGKSGPVRVTVGSLVALIQPAEKIH
ncbi:hypothetical protein [Lysinibacter cavernae]|uniref:hypothetical protein n=1 Tax=Lysinibacter cavernae TaxID=1640652 RepID=UPI003617D34C